MKESHDSIHNVSLASSSGDVNSEEISGVHVATVMIERETA